MKHKPGQVLIGTELVCLLTGATVSIECSEPLESSRRIGEIWAEKQVFSK